MRPETVGNLRQLDAAEWFSRVGQVDLNTDVAVLLGSWDEATERCADPAWEALELEMANRLRERVVAADAARLGVWNTVVQELKQYTEPLINRKCGDLLGRLPQVFRASVEWDILHLCLESEHCDIVEPGFYSALGFWYVNGHFPCGWVADRQHPNGGRPIVF